MTTKMSPPLTMQNRDEKKGPLQIMIQSSAARKHPPSCNLQRELIDKINKWIAGDLRSFSIVEDKGFQEMASFLNKKFHPVTRAQVMRHLCSVEKEYDLALKGMLTASSAVSVTKDCWSDEQCNSYASLTVHFIDTNWVLQCHLLCCSRLPGKHTGPNLSAFLVHAFEKYNITSKVVCISTDNASNAVASTRITAEQFGRLIEIEVDAHQNSEVDNEIAASQLIAALFVDDIASSDAAVNDAVAPHTNMSALNNASTTVTASTKTGNSVVATGLGISVYSVGHDGSTEHTAGSLTVHPPLEDTLNLSDVETWISSENDSAPSLSSEAGLLTTAQVTMNRNPCIAHQLQFSVRAALDSACVKAALFDVRKTCLFFRKSSGGWDVLRELQAQQGKFPLRLLLDVPTRWGSTLAMVTRYLKLIEHVDQAVLRLYENGFKFGALIPGELLTAPQIATLKAIADVLADVEKVTAGLGAENHPTLQLKDVLIAGLFVLLEQTKNRSITGSAGHVLSHNLWTDISSRFYSMRQKTPTLNYLAVVASFLDPASVRMRHLELLKEFNFSTDAAIEVVASLARALFSNFDMRSADITDGSSRAPEGVGDPTEKKHLRGIQSIIAAAQGKGKVETVHESWRSEVRHEICSYKALAWDCENFDVLKFWKAHQLQFPKLSKVARVCFSVPAASTASERVFSLAGIIRSKRRARLSPELTEVCVKVGHYVRKERRKKS